MKFCIAICVLLCVSLAAGNISDPFRQIQASHKSKTLKTGKLRLLSGFSSERKEFYDTLLKPMLKVRDVGSTGHREVREHIVNNMKGLGWNVEQDIFTDNTPLGQKTFTNIIATHNVNAPRRLVYACHYDSKYYQFITFIGMTDSAVPCAMLLDLGKTLNASLWSTRDSKGSEISLQFIFFDGEEAFKSWTSTDSIYGSRHLAEKWAKNFTQLYREVEPLSQIERIDVFVLLDLIGASNPEFKNWFPSTSNIFERLRKTELRLARESLLDGISSSGRSSQYFRGGVMQSMGGIEDDHIPFQRKKVPILHAIAYPFPSVWHKESDNAQAYDAVSVANLLKIFRVMIAEYLHLNPVSN